MTAEEIRTRLRDIITELEKTRSGMPGYQKYPYSEILDSVDKLRELIQLTYTKDFTAMEYRLESAERKLVVYRNLYNRITARNAWDDAIAESLRSIEDME